MQKFSIKEAIAFGWRTWKSNWKFLVPLTLVIGFINFVPGTLVSYLSDQYGENFPVWASVGVSLLLWLVSAVVALGMVKIFLSLVDGKPAAFGDLFSLSRRVPGYVVGTVIYTVLAIAATLALVIPGIIVAIRLQFWVAAMVDQNLGPWAAMKYSWKATGGSVLRLVGLSLVLGLLSLLGLLPLGLGLLIVYPLVYLANLSVYRKLSSA